MPPPGSPVPANILYAALTKYQVVDAKKRSETRSSTEPPNFILDEDVLTCAICLEIMHYPMNVIPCSHKFCASCIYEWLDRKKNCPKCRLIASEVIRDSPFNQVIESYLNAFPSRKRTESDLAALDEAELKHLQKKQAERSRDEDEEYERGVYIVAPETRYRHAEEDARIQRLQRQKEEREARVRQARAQARKDRVVRCQPRLGAAPACPYNLRNRRPN